MLKKYWWIIIPNLIASIALMFNEAFVSNCIYVPGYLLMIWYNSQIDDKVQKRYFMILELFAIIGVIYYLYKKWIKV